MSLALASSWSFNPIVTAFPRTVLPNVAFYNATNTTLTYQIQVSWPLSWASTNTNSSVLSMYVLDGNALGMTATEAWRRRGPVEFNQPDNIVVSIGYPITDSVYSTQRNSDFRPPGDTDPTVPVAGANDFIKFIDQALRPWVKNSFFGPKVNFGRDALYGHSFGGLFTIYALVTHPGLFDTFFSASPALFWNNGLMLDEAPKLLASQHVKDGKKPAFRLTYGSLESHPMKRRTETEAEFENRLAILTSLNTTTMAPYCNQLYNSLKNSTNLRDIVLKEYVGSDHASNAAVSITDGIDYFIDWP